MPVKKECQTLLKKSTPSSSMWQDVEKVLPQPLQTVWLTNGKGWVQLGCLVESDGGWHWAESNGVIYADGDTIVSECESEDLDVKYWQSLPKLDFTKQEVKITTKEQLLEVIRLFAFDWYHKYSGKLTIREYASYWVRKYLKK